MTAASLLSPLCFREFDNNGLPLAFGTVQSYQAGTVTPVATYSDPGAITPNLNPLTLNSRGEAQIYVLANVNYKFVVKDLAGNQIRVTDNVQQSQLLTLYAGVDTGSTNAYIVNFAANFSAYADGIVLYFIPSHSNTGASTINVNGLGVISLINQSGTALSANELLASQVATIMYKGGSFLLIQGSQQGIVSYGGADTGAVNAYVVALTNQYFAYVTGNVLFFIPSNTNTGPSTINVKGLGAQSILLQGSGALNGGEMIGGLLYELIYTGSYFVLLNPSPLSGSFVVTADGLTTSPTMTIYYAIGPGPIVTLSFGGVSGTSNATSFGLTGFSNGLQGLSHAMTSPLFPAIDNSVAGACYWTIPNQIGGSRVILTLNTTSGLWTNVGTKALAGGSFSYRLS